MMARVDCRRGKPTIGERPHQSEKFLLPAPGSVEKDDGRPAMGPGRVLEKQAGDALAGLRREGEVLAAIGSCIDSRPRLSCEGHTRPLDHLKERRSNPRRVGSLG